MHSPAVPEHLLVGVVSMPTTSTATKGEREREREGERERGREGGREGGRRNKMEFDKSSIL